MRIGACVESSVTVPGPLATPSVNSGARSVIDEPSSCSVLDTLYETSINPRPFSWLCAIVPPSDGPSSVAVGLAGGRSGTANETSWPCSFSKPIWSLP